MAVMIILITKKKIINLCNLTGSVALLDIRIWDQLIPVLYDKKYLFVFAFAF